MRQSRVTRPDVAGTEDGLGKGKDAEGKHTWNMFLSGHMVNIHMTVIRVDGELPKNVDS